MSNPNVLQVHLSYVGNYYFDLFLLILEIKNFLPSYEENKLLH